MSKLYKKYLELKSQNNENIYMFKSGIFYIFLDNDAQKMSKLLNLKLTNLNSEIQKCGFPTSSFNKYNNIIKNSNYNICIIDELNHVEDFDSYCLWQKTQIIMQPLLNADIDNLSISEAFNLLTNIQRDFKSILKN